MPYSGDPRGSLWRKWDLHVHTPTSCETAYGDRQQEQTWERHLEALAGLPPEIEVVGINDYFLIEGYRRVRAAWEAGQLPNLKLVLPVIELRLDHLAGHTNTQRINYHVVFSNDVDPDTIERAFLAGLIAEHRNFRGTIGHREGMAAFGRAVRAVARRVTNRTGATSGSGLRTPSFRSLRCSRRSQAAPSLMAGS